MVRFFFWLLVILIIIGIFNNSIDFLSVNKTWVITIDYNMFFDNSITAISDAIDWVVNLFDSAETNTPAPAQS